MTKRQRQRQRQRPKTNSKDKKTTRQRRKRQTAKEDDLTARNFINCVHAVQITPNVVRVWKNGYTAAS